MAKQPLDIGSLKPNSHAYKEGIKNDQTKETSGSEREKLNPIVKKDGVVSTKKPLGQKLTEMFISDDAQDVKTYVFMDVLVPTIKNTILDVIEMILFGSTSGRSRNRPSRDKERVSYSAYYKSEYNGRRGSSRDRRDDDREYRQNEKVDYRNIILRDRRDAEEVVNEMKRRIDEYNQATIADLFDLIDVTSNYVDNNWGWTDERDIGIRRVSAGYLIDVAEARYLD